MRRIHGRPLARSATGSVVAFNDFFAGATRTIKAEFNVKRGNIEFDQSTIKADWPGVIFQIEEAFRMGRRRPRTNS